MATPITDKREPSQRYIITLVHGTFASNSRWMAPGSRFSTQLSSALNADVQILSFRWSGKNSHSARAEAGHQLARHLDETATTHPEAAHYLVAHSHGGNVALYALRDKGIHPSVRGVACLATPFIQVSKRGRRFFQAIETYWFIASFIICLVSVFALTRLLEPINEDWDGVVGVLAILCIFVCWVPFWALGETLCANLERYAESREQRLALGRPGDRVPLLVVRVKGDEAELWLRTLLSMSMPAERLWTLLEWTLSRLYPAFLISFFACMLIVQVLVALESVPFVNVGWLESMVVVSILAVPVLFFLAGPILLGVWFLNLVTRGSGAGFGEGFLDSLLLRTSFSGRDSE